MACLATVHSTSVKRARFSQSARAVKNIGIVLFGGFALPETAAVAEIFQSANALAGTGTTLNGQIPYKVCLLSAAGGRIGSSSSVFVWTESVEAYPFAEGFWMLFIGGGDGARTAVRDGRLTAWLRRECPRSDLVVPMGEGRLLLEATGSGRAGSNQRWARALRKAPDTASPTQTSPVRCTVHWRPFRKISGLKLPARSQITLCDRLSTPGLPRLSVRMPPFM